jgi:1-deoxy-D-xylulose 5-phosphate reductoisomerase
MSSPSSTDGGAGQGRGPRGVAIIGSTGSIGRQTVDVLAGHPEAFRVVALAAGTNGTLLAEQAAQLRPRAVALADDAALTRLDLPVGTERVRGADALVELATRADVDLVVVGTGGVVSLRPVLAALAAGKVVATANKETLVAGGHLVMPQARALAAAVAAGRPADPFASPLAWLRPIDSEHSAIWQCLVGEAMASVAALILTASGGPFLEVPEEDMALVTPAQALRHPTWTMGAKITIDSATLANKGLEVIEAHWLYDVDYDAIEVVIHPQSVVHSAVRFVDGSLKAQLGTPDMRLPIQYALTYPDRRPSLAAAPDLVAISRLDFGAPDEARFPALRIAREAGRAGPRASAALIAADDVAVARFIAGTLEFRDIPRLLEAAVTRAVSGPAAGPREPDLDQLVVLDAEIRAAFATGPIGGAA